MDVFIFIVFIPVSSVDPDQRPKNAVSEQSLDCGLKRVDKSHKHYIYEVPLDNHNSKQHQNTTSALLIQVQNHENHNINICKPKTT